jgi:hypothetical protein
MKIAICEMVRTFFLSASLFNLGPSYGTSYTSYSYYSALLPLITEPFKSSKAPGYLPTSISLQILTCSSYLVFPFEIGMPVQWPSPQCWLHATHVSQHSFSNRGILIAYALQVVFLSRKLSSLNIIKFCRFHLVLN